MNGINMKKKIFFTFIIVIFVAFSLLWLHRVMSYNLQLIGNYASGTIIFALVVFFVFPLRKYQSEKVVPTFIGYFKNLGLDFVEIMKLIIKFIIKILQILVFMLFINLIINKKNKQ